MCALGTGLQTCALRIWTSHMHPPQQAAEIAGADLFDSRPRHGHRTRVAIAALARRHLLLVTTKPIILTTSRSLSTWLSKLSRGSMMNRRNSARLVSGAAALRSEEHPSELPSLMRNSYAVFSLKKKKYKIQKHTHKQHR